MTEHISELDSHKTLMLEHKHFKISVLNVIRTLMEKVDNMQTEG